MDDVLGQLVIMLNLLLIAVLMWPMCRDSWRDKESHNLRLVTVTVLAIIPLALMVLTATGYFIPRCVCQAAGSKRFIW